MENENPGQRFELLVERVFKQQRFTTTSNVRLDVRGRRREVDLMVEWNGEAKTAVEVKTFRTRMPAAEDIARAYRQVDEIRIVLQADHALLATNLRRAQIPPLGIEFLEANVLCIEDLIYFAKDDIGLISDLIEADRELSSSLRDFDNPLDLTYVDRKPTVSMLHMRVAASKAPAGPTSSPKVDKGARLALELEEIPPGKGDKLKLSSGREGVPWRLLEMVGFDALKYIFERQFHRWNTQGDVGSDDQRFDVLAKVKGDDVFCATLIQDFCSRHVLFEFKNYKIPLKPNHIFVTEKYLYPTARRGTAIVISPFGFSDEAKAAAQGALRDAGKLFIDLTVSKLCQMLRAYDEGTSPDEAMELLLDSFLQDLGR